MKTQKMKYSSTERRMLAMLSEHPTSSDRLIDRWYKKESERPYNARGIVNAVIYSLIKKMNHNDEPFVIQRTPRSGPKPSSIWIARKKKKTA
jgi:hypothetical protein